MKFCCKTTFLLLFAQIIFEQFLDVLTGFSFCAVGRVGPF